MINNFINFNYLIDYFQLIVQFFINLSVNWITLKNSLIIKKNLFNKINTYFNLLILFL